MKKYFLLFIPCFFFLQHSSAQFIYQWARNINSPGNDIGYNIAVDKNGNSYITGTLPLAADFDPGPGTAILTSIGGTDIFLAKYDKDGNYVWAKSIGSSGTDEGWGINVDGAGNVYITGYFSGTADFDPGSGTAILTPVGLDDAFIGKYDTDGNYVWAKSFGSLRDNDFGRNISVDDNGNVYLTGWFTDTVDFDPGPGIDQKISKGYTDIYFSKFDKDGNYLWAKTIGTMQIDYGSDIAVDKNGNIYICGFFTNGPADFDPGPGTANLSAVNAQDAFFAKYDANGNYVWAKNIGTTGNDWARAITVDKDNNVLITGYIENGKADFNPGPDTAYLTSKGGQDAFFAKYDTNGNYLWAKQIGSVSNDEGRDIAADADGNVYITGVFRNTADFDPGPGVKNLSPFLLGNDDFFFAKYDAIGNHLCSDAVGAGGGDQSWSIAVDTAGYVYLTGYFQGNVDFDPSAGVANLNAGSGWDVFFAKYKSCSSTIKPKSVFQSSDTTFCLPFDVIKCIDFYDNSLNNPTSWKWYFPGANPDSSVAQNPKNICYQGAGKYSITLIASNSAGSDTLSVKDLITVHQSPATPGTRLSNDTIYCLVSGMSYQWFFNGSPVSGANDAFVVALQKGNYYVQITDSNGCMVNSNVVLVTNIHSMFLSTLRIYPNPVVDELTVEGNLKKHSSVKIEIVDLLGKTILINEDENPSDHFNVKFDLGKLSGGVYFVSISCGDEAIREKLIKN